MDVPGNCGESESDKAIEYSEELNCFYFSPSPPYFPPLPTTFPPSPLYFPPYSPASSNSSKIYCGRAIFLREWLPNQPMEVIFPWRARQAVELGLFAEYRIQDRGGVLDVIPGGKLMQINGLEQQHEDIDRSIASEELALLLDGRDKGTGFGRHIRSNLEFNDSVEAVAVQQYRIWYMGGEVHLIPSGEALRYEGLEVSDNGDLFTTLEPPLIFQEKSSIRLWQGNHGDWGAEFRFEWNWLNIGTFKIESSALTNEWVFRCRGGKDHIDFPFPELSPNRNREELTTACITEIPTPALPPTTQQENPYEDFGLGCSGVTGNDGVEAVGIGSWNCCDSTTIQGSQSKLNYACWEYSTHIWPTHSNRTPMLVDQVEIPLLNSDTLPSDQALASAVDTNSVLVKEIPPPLVLPTALQENLDEDLDNDEVEATGIGGEGIDEDEIVEDQLRTGCFGKRKRKEKIPGRERGNNKITRVRNVIPLEEILQIKEMLLKDAAKQLKVSRYALKRACRKHGINRWPPRNEQKTSAVVDQEGIPEPSENSCNDEVEAVGMGVVGSGKGEVKDGKLNCGSSDKGERNEKIPQGERANNKGTGVRIEIPLEEILKYKDMCRKDAATHLQVSISTLKRVCRGYQIYRWPPRDEHKLIGQSRPNESPAIEDQERNPQKNSTTLLPSNEESASMDTDSVTVKVRYEGDTFKFKLSKKPWGMAELEEQLKKRLPLETLVRYKDEDGELISIVCDDDLQECILSSRSQGTTSIVLLLEQKGSR